MTDTRASTGLRVIVSGYIGLLPAGGVTWDYVQYPLGLRALGHDVFYVEDTGLWPAWQTGDPGDAGANVRYLRRVMEAFGLGDRWGYRDGVTGQWFGLSECHRREVLASADVLLNISAATPVDESYATIPVRALIDSDPFFTQVQFISGAGLSGRVSGMRELLGRHTHHFTFAENIAAPDCRVPEVPFRWRTTRQPIAMECWPDGGGGGSAFTTIMNWNAAQAIHHDGQRWGQKDVEFTRFMTLPRRVRGASFAVAVGHAVSSGFPAARARHHGWAVVDADDVARDPDAYRRFIASSLAEFSVAKEAYVKARTGWFSCRSACYLASGRSVVTQDTGWSRHVPSGSGLFAFRDLDEALGGVEAVLARPRQHGAAARELAREHFAADRVLGRLLEELAT
jgi:hypothetical protein